MLFANRATGILLEVLRRVPVGSACILPANICEVVPFAIRKIGLEPVFVDIAPDNFCLDAQQTIRLIQADPDRYAGVVYVHTYGALQDTAALYRAIRAVAPSIAIIDDRCLCAPILTWAEQSTLSLYSTGYAKFIDLGHGGIGVDSETEIEICDTPAWLPNSPLPDNIGLYMEQVEAARLEQAKLKFIKNKIYNDNIPQSFRLADDYQNWRYNVIYPTTNARDAAYDAIFASGLFASRHYKPWLGIDNAPVANDLWGRVLNLFNDRYVTEDKVSRIAQIVGRSLRTAA